MLCRILEYFGTPEAVYFADPVEYDALTELPELVRQELKEKSLDGAERILEQCARLNLAILTVQDTAYPERLRQIRDYPLVLYRKGKWFPVDEMAAIGMVGTRRATGYGENTETAFFPEGPVIDPGKKQQYRRQYSAGKYP